MPQPKATSLLGTFLPWLSQAACSLTGHWRAKRGCPCRRCPVNRQPGCWGFCRAEPHTGLRALRTSHGCLWSVVLWCLATSNACTHVNLSAPGLEALERALPGHASR